ncbi:hypothetical protein SCALIN_C28_0120 [Candidatus Scalindua japonica]|uniref:Uncharacterized protein n=1 Tax=Candidatus Scalindua japonica TaxID=1284222 RepID=A0A286U195_9BACT|nr:hypothetical protein [Candidatus Scalindua japonica]GAX61918.1 hypothetical protein SCALIN_C28_0120 [Candidatus Scalindua japonica]
MKYVKIIGLIIGCLLTAHVSKIYAKDSRSVIKVGVYVRGEENLNGVIEDYVSKELKSLGNIVVTFVQLDCAIDIVVKTLNNGNRSTKNGCAISVTIIDRFDTLPITRAIEELDMLVPKIRAQPLVIKQLEALSKKLVGIVISTANIKSFQNSFLYTGSAGQLRELCSGIIKDFNNEYLKKRKKAMQRKYTLSLATDSTEEASY